MNIIIAGGGKVGSTLVRQLSAEGYDLTLIDSDKRIIDSSVEQYDVMAVEGNCASMPVLLQAGVMHADLLIATTSEDEVNLLCCTTAHGLNPKLHTIARIRNPEYTDQIYALRDVFALSLAVNPEKQAATEIERLLKYPGFLHRDTFAKGKTEIVELRVDGGSKLCNVPLMELPGIVKCKVLVCAVLRGGTAMAPSGSFFLREGDRIFVTAPTNTLTVLLKNLGIITRRVRQVMICGGSRVAYYLAGMLQRDGIHTTMVEKDPARCVQLAGQLEKVNVICADSTNLGELESQGLRDCDALVSLTGMDEQNIIISLLASSRGIPQIITKLGRTENRGAIANLPLGSVVCPKELCCNTIVRYVRAMQNQTGAAVSVHAIADGQAEAVEFLVDEKTKHCGEPLKKIKLKPNVLVASIAHGSGTEIPNGDSQFHVGDTIVLVTSGQGILHQLNDIFE